MPARLSGAIIRFDVSLRRITFDCLDSEDWRRSATDGSASSPSAVEEWVGQFCGQEVHVAMEAYRVAVRWPERSRARLGCASGRTRGSAAYRGASGALTDQPGRVVAARAVGGGSAAEAWIAPEHVDSVAFAAALAQGADRRAQADQAVSADPLGALSPRAERRRARDNLKPYRPRVSRPVEPARRRPRARHRRTWHGRHPRA